MRIVVESVVARLRVDGIIKAEVICTSQAEAIREAEKMKKRMRISGKIRVTGQDLTPEEVEAVKDGEMLIG